MSSVYIKGKTKLQATRTAKTYGENRLCSFNNCETVLSKYNKKELCFFHSPKEVGRIRGWKEPT